MPEFEWDDEKSRGNLAKHGIPFELLPACFEGPMLAQVDDRFDDGETRWIAIAFLGDVPVVIAYTVDDERVRLISARKATRRERSRFAAFLAAAGR